MSWSLEKIIPKACAFDLWEEYPAIGYPAIYITSTVGL
jgi:uncharacterized protein YjaG (DUF416 family)